MEVINILEKLVLFDTIKDKQNNEIVEWIKQYLLEYGFECRTIVEESTNRKCLIAQLGNEPILAFSGHIDTVNATEGWKSNPFEINVQNGNIYGLGVCDMKGGIAAFLKACTSIDKNRIKHGIKLFFTFDEETDFGGIKLLLKNKEPFPKYLILAEPTDMKTIIATKGGMGMKVAFFGKSAHSSMPNEGKNAIIEAHKFINELLELQEKLKKEKNEIFSIPYINIGTINGGDAVNKVPDKCIVEFDARTISKEHNTIIEEEVKKILEKYDSKLEIELNINSYINNDNKMITDLEKITGNKRKAENYLTEASFIENTEIVILGPGPITAHQCNEHIEIEKLDRLVEIYGDIIEEYCC